MPGAWLSVAAIALVATLTRGDQVRAATRAWRCA